MKKFKKTKRRTKKYNRNDADILTAKNMLVDQSLGYKVPFSFYENQSEKISKQ